MKKITLFIGIILLLILVILLYVWLNIKYNIGFPCAIKQTFGIYCPGCGLTRAGISLLQLDLYQAFRYNAFSLLLIPLVFFSVLCFVWEWIFAKSSIVGKIPVLFWSVVFIAFLGYGIVRNFVPYLQPINL